VLANRISWKKSHNHLTHRSHLGEHNKCTSRKKKIVTLRVIKKFCLPVRNRLDTFWQA